MESPGGSTWTILIRTFRALSRMVDSTDIRRLRLKGLLQSYDDDIPTLTVYIDYPQTDNRTVVTSFEPKVSGTLILAEDKYATTVQYLMKALYNYYNNNATMAVSATLQNGEIRELQCPITNYFITCTDSTIGYRGLPGTYTLTFTLTLPDGYKGQSSDSKQFTQTVTVSVQQNPRYDSLWVSKEPSKMTYHVGEMLDLSGIMLMYKDTSQTENSAYVYITSNQFSAYGIEIYTYTNEGKINLLTSPLTKSMDGREIEVHSTTNNSYTFFGPLR